MIIKQARTAAVLHLKPVTLRTANAFVLLHHRHHKPSRGCRFCVGVYTGDELRGVAITSNTRARMLHCEGYSAEVVRVATDGVKNGCSMLYGACRRAWFALGGHRIYTYTLPSEGGASLRGAGWEIDAKTTGGGEWSRDDRPRQLTLLADQKKTRWISINSKLIKGA